MTFSIADVINANQELNKFRLIIIIKVMKDSFFHFFVVLILHIEK